MIDPSLTAERKHHAALVAAEPVPEALLRGRFSLYEKDGAMALFYRLDGQDEDRRLDIPAWAVQAAQQTLETGQHPSALGMMRAALSGMRG